MPLDDTHPRTIWVNACIRHGCLNSFLWGDPPYPADAEFIDFVTSTFPPTYILAAEKDSLIPVQHSYDVSDKLRQENVEVHVGLGKGAEHGFTELPPSIWPEGCDWWDVIQRALDWAVEKTT